VHRLVVATARDDRAEKQRPEGVVSRSHCGHYPPIGGADSNATCAIDDENLRRIRGCAASGHSTTRS
jgi:hypothetical protein